MYHHVLVGTDGSMTSSRAVRAAARLAQTHCARLTIAHAFDPRRSQDQDDPTMPRELRWTLTSGARAEALVGEAVNAAQAEGCGGALRVEGRAEPGNPLSVLRALIRELQPDVVVVGNADLHRFRLRRGIGPTLSRHAGVDVIVVNTVGRPPSGLTSATSAA